MTVVDEKQARPRRVRNDSPFVALRTALTAWLSRPLASFHLVLALTGVLTVIGAVMVLSASSVASYNPKTGSGVYSLFFRHLMFVAIGGIVFWLGLRVRLERIRRMSATITVICLGLLMLVLTPLGSTVNGSQGWFKLGVFTFQPVEAAKVALAFWGAHILVIKYNVLHQWRHLLVPVVPVALLMFALVMLQPDLGGTITLAVVLLGLLWFAGAPKRLFGVILAGGLSGVLVLAIIAPYRLARVMSFLSPDADTSAEGFQANQAKLALADGGLFGKGLGQGASNWGYLPNVQNDFIFALIGEELGFVGCAVVLALFAGVAVVGLRIATRNIDPWIRIVAGTLTVFLVAQAAINIGYVVGLLPVTGVTLPLISYGGTSLVITMLIMGVLANAARHEPEAVAALRSHGPGKFGRLLRLPAPDPYRPPSARKGTRAAGNGTKAARPAPRAARPAPAQERRRSARRTTANRGARSTANRRGHW
ncbi:putative lipid II flippase FtsW [Amycolatopsis echigonensis]|uniref:Probable peptidoglycan glycosyltransferase FtsW n=1 Tax=Amycolatopsis echigonensis TaxID=2576905 RepID=A0A2N3WQR3_9PSEU|nr:MULTISPECIES: putative lipid II flippase FtsW [Amycolatopsis]MBB2506027.1 putative lipid II flippase FtsW [Amycolatopsis echigonensis]PKV96202.1 cell division-specific peptidoglycan biosynthesis regulator FtsW [Amycolatopsis niigatensis]